MGRKKKYCTELQRNLAIKLSKKCTRAPSIKSRYFRLVIPNLQQFEPQSPSLTKLKGDTLQLLLQKQNPVGLQYYKVAAETHPTTKVPHLDILLLYKASRLTSLNRFNYLIKHGNLTRYKKLNDAILSYGDKEDLAPLSNLPKDVSLILKVKKIQSDPFEVMHQQMLKDPFHFDVHRWLADSQLLYAVSKTGWSKAISLLKHQQQVQCNRLLYSKPGFQRITKQLIKQLLSPKEYRQYTKNVAFLAKIVAKINEIVGHGCTRPFKTKQLLLVSPPDTGKTSLALKVKQFISVYHMGVKNWFPCYRSNIYKMILWDQFNLKSMPYPQLLKFLQGLQMDLQYKGGSVLKTDNQLIYMTSNMTLRQHVESRFSSERSRALSEANLRARIQEVILPQGVDLFLLQKLFKAV